MDRFISPALLSLTVVVAISLCGCGQKLYRAETTLHADGSVDRAIYQLRSETPEEAQKPTQWRGVTFAGEITPEQWTGTIAQLPKSAHTKQTPYFAAWGHFKSPRDLPGHVVINPPEKLGPGIPSGKLVVEYDRINYVFVVEHRWSETLKDIVSLSDIDVASDELVNLPMGLGPDILRDAFGKDYDIAELQAWFDTEGRAWFKEIVHTFYDASARQEPDTEETRRKLHVAMARVCAKYGLNLISETDKLLDENESRVAVETFIRRLLNQKMRSKDGRPFEPPRDFESAIDVAIKRRFDEPEVKEAFEQKFAALVIRIVGIYNAEFLGPHRRFSYSLKTPGTIVETTGTRIADNEVAWAFDAKEAYPLGYRMLCRSLAPMGDLQKKLLNGEPLREPVAMSEFVALLKDDPGLRDAVRKCGVQQSLQPLFARREMTAAEPNSPAHQNVMRLMRLLGTKP